MNGYYHSGIILAYCICKIDLIEILLGDT